MLKIFFLSCLLCIPFFTQAQVLDPTTINSAGGKLEIASTTNQSNNNWLLDWTLCEPFAIQTWCSKNKIIFSTGFLQPSLMLNPALMRAEAFEFKLKWGPNPVANYLLLSCKQAGIDIIRINIVDSDGHKIETIVGPYSGLDFSKQISFDSVNTGIYLVTIHYKVANKFTQVKILKIIKL